jgi:serine/threonine protein kinase
MQSCKPFANLGSLLFFSNLSDIHGIDVAARLSAPAEVASEPTLLWRRASQTLRYDCTGRGVSLSDRRETKAGYALKESDQSESEREQTPPADSAAMAPRGDASLRPPTKIPMHSGEVVLRETPADPLIGTTLDGRFRIARLLGKGQMASVYVAEQLSMSRNVAIKVLAPDLEVNETAVGRFRQEVTAVSRLHSPHAIEFYDTGQTQDGHFYIAMELLPGQNLRERLREETLIDPVEVAGITFQVASVLQEAHEAGVLHRDLKPENIHFCVQATPLRPFVKLLDFGLAKLSDPGPEDPTLTGKRQTVGTPAYMAPEMIIEERAVDHRCDVYALAAICFEMLTGTMPYQEKSTMKMALAHVRDAIPSATERNPALPRATDKFFQRALAKNADERPESATALARELAEALHS